MYSSPKRFTPRGFLLLRANCLTCKCRFPGHVFFGPLYFSLDILYCFASVLNISLFCSLLVVAFFIFLVLLVFLDSLDVLASICVFLSRIHIFHSFFFSHSSYLSINIQSCSHLSLAHCSFPTVFRVFQYCFFLLLLCHILLRSLL